MNGEKKKKTSTSEIRRTDINIGIKCLLWGIAAGRCEICNAPLNFDSKYGVRDVYAQLAHIHAVGKNGPRHKADMTQEEINNIDNLMLLCPEHHHLIDKQPRNFPVSDLLKMKKAHEERIRKVTEIPNDAYCKIVTYFSDIDNINIFSSPIALQRAVTEINMYSRGDLPIELHAEAVTKYDPGNDIICLQAKMLEQRVKEYFNDIVKTNEKIALFALAPQPLLFKLGFLLCDQLAVTVFQYHRNVNKWVWPDDNSEVEFIIKKTCSKSMSTVAMVIDLSAEIVDERITSILGDACSIYHLTIANPNRNFVRNLKIQDKFVEAFRKLMEQIKNENIDAVKLHVFPAMPASLAVRAGMDFMPKADLPMIIYEQANSVDGFFETLQIGG